MRQDLMIRVLGPIDLVGPAGVVAIGSRNLRALLGSLAISVGHATPADQLAFAIWGDDLPRSVDNTLQSYVSRLRRLLGPDAIRSEDHSYQLDAGPDQLDALVFERLLLEATDARSEPSRCQPLCRAALDLWRGQPFGELGDDEPFRLEALRLDELRVAAMELSLEAELALGHQELIVGELENAVEEYPYRERLWLLLIEALMQDDRRVEAMRACTRLRAVLADTGMEAQAELRKLEGQILGAEASG